MCVSFVRCVCRCVSGECWVCVFRVLARWVCVIGVLERCVCVLVHCVCVFSVSARNVCVFCPVCHLCMCVSFVNVFVICEFVCRLCLPFCHLRVICVCDFAICVSFVCLPFAIFVSFV